MSKGLDLFLLSYFQPIYFVAFVLLRKTKIFTNLTFRLLAEKNKGKASQTGSCHVLDVCLALSQARRAAR